MYTTVPRDVLGPPDPPGGHERLDALRLVPRDNVHVADEGPRGNGVDVDVFRREQLGQPPREVVEAGLAGRVGERVVVRHVEAVDGGDVDDLRRPLLARRGAQQRSEPLREEERPLQVHVEGLVPPLLRELVERRHPTRAGVVHQDVEAVLPRREFPGEGRDAVEPRHVVRDGDALPELRQLRRGARTDVRVPGRDVRAHPAADEFLRDHAADALAAPRDERDAAVEVE